MSIAIVAAMLAAASCACNNNSQPAEEVPVEGCCGGDCADCSTGCESTEECETCDSTAADCCQQAK